MELGLPGGPACFGAITTFFAGGGVGGGVALGVEPCTGVPGGGVPAALVSASLCEPRWGCTKRCTLDGIGDAASRRAEGVPIA